MKKILLAGATGYLGSHIARASAAKGYGMRVIARSPEKLRDLGIVTDDVCRAELVQPETLKGCCAGIDTVISTVGITRQKDGLTYLDVDYQANLNLLNEAREQGVRKFIYVSVLHGDRFRELKICDAKERFVDALQASGLQYCVIRPTGFFSDVTEFFEMARRGRIYLFGTGEQRTNPIHGADLASVCLDAIGGSAQVLEVGGPETLTYNDIARIAFEAAGTKPSVLRIPDWIRVSLLMLVRAVTSSKFYGPLEFFLTVTAVDMVAPEYGTHRLKEHFLKLRSS